MSIIHIAIYSVLNVSYGGGFERFSKEVAPRLRALGHNVSIITTKAGERRDASIEGRLFEAGIEVYEVDNYAKPTIPKISVAKEIVTLVRDADVLYFNNAFALNELLVYLLRKITKVKVVSGYHGISPEVGGLTRTLYYRLVNGGVSRHFDAHHVVNKEREVLLRSYGYRHIYRIPNGVDTNKFVPNQKGDIFTVLFVVRLTHQKGFDILIDCIDFLNECLEDDDMMFLIIGDGPLSYLAKELERKFKNVKYTGYIAGNELIKAYQSSHVFVAPSRYEEFLLTALEAQACGTPVVASNIPGPRETILNGITGLLVKSSTKEFSRAILYFKKLWYDSKDRYYEYSKNARKKALSYDWDTIVKKLENMFIEVSKL